MHCSGDGHCRVAAARRSSSIASGTPTPRSPGVGRPSTISVPWVPATRGDRVKKRSVSPRSRGTRAKHRSPSSREPRRVSTWSAPSIPVSLSRNSSITRVGPSRASPRRPTIVADTCMRAADSTDAECSASQRSVNARETARSARYGRHATRMAPLRDQSSSGSAGIRLPKISATSQRSGRTVNSPMRTRIPSTRNATSLIRIGWPSSFARRTAFPMARGPSVLRPSMSGGKHDQ